MFGDYPSAVLLAMRFRCAACAEEWSPGAMRLNLMLHPVGDHRGRPVVHVIGRDQRFQPNVSQAQLRQPRMPALVPSSDTRLRLRSMACCRKRPTSVMARHGRGGSPAVLPELVAPFPSAQRWPRRTGALLSPAGNFGAALTSLAVATLMAPLRRMIASHSQRPRCAWY